MAEITASIPPVFLQRLSDAEARPAVPIPGVPGDLLSAKNRRIVPRPARDGTAWQGCIKHRTYSDEEAAPTRVGVCWLEGSGIGAETYSTRAPDTLDRAEIKKNFRLCSIITVRLGVWAHFESSGVFLQ
ncbi:hypothetical protein BO71DRAFT_26352 [Aspergillus ellipticus CBS 707.79]|uniref:Uncharacterized protein n=1 Tax=Aspergillus ellipticus CBS 707.79 TaxID=1448320 RepID=A0A319D4J6_9EURO|nr:hypothetical protein BO71DRAFT_26352 [Aspergillus ellipticus CBS 707.79]